MAKIAQDDDAPAPGQRPRTALVTGATGYIGGRLVPQLLAAGWRVRVLARRPERLADRPWAGQVEMAEGDAGDAESLGRAMEGVEVAYYLIHSMGSGVEFEIRDRYLALLFGTAAREAGVRRIVYLGGLHPDDEKLSTHLQSRREVGDILLHSGVPTAVLQAAVILGSGSASFEMLRYLSERLPIMVVPRWVNNRIQPIAIRDVLRYLVGAAELPAEVNRTFDIGGPDVLTYLEMMHRYAAIAGLAQRRIVKVPVLTPSLSSHWVGVVTPVPAGLAKPLVQSLVHEVVCHERDLAEFVPDPPGGLLGYDQAVDLALRRVHEANVSSPWTGEADDGSVVEPSDPMPTDPSWAGGSLYTDRRSRRVEVAPPEVWDAVERSFLGSGRWKIEAARRPGMLRLRAQDPIPGLAWLELNLEPAGSGTLVRQTTYFHPRGLAGHAFWQLGRPVHALVLNRVLGAVVEAARQPAPSPVPQG